MSKAIVKGVVASVRSYLSAIGHPISSVQGHEVVALSLGLKGKEVLAALNNKGGVLPKAKPDDEIEIFKVGQQPFSVQHMLEKKWSLKAIIPVPVDVFRDLMALNDYISEAVTGCCGLEDIGMEVAPHYYDGDTVALCVSGYISNPEYFFEEEIEAIESARIEGWVK